MIRGGCGIARRLLRLVRRAAAEAGIDTDAAEKAAESAGLIEVSGGFVRFRHPLKLCEALASALTLAGCTRTPEAAAEVMMDAVRKFQTTIAITDA
jgi:hypothetical protein